MSRLILAIGQQNGDLSFPLGLISALKSEGVRVAAHDAGGDGMLSAALERGEPGGKAFVPCLRYDLRSGGSRKMVASSARTADTGSVAVHDLRGGGSDAVCLLGGSSLLGQIGGARLTVAHLLSPFQAATDLAAEAIEAWPLDRADHVIVMEEGAFSLEEAYPLWTDTDTRERALAGGAVEITFRTLRAATIAKITASGGVLPFGLDLTSTENRKAELGLSSLSRVELTSLGSWCDNFRRETGKAGPLLGYPPSE